MLKWLAPNPLWYCTESEKKLLWYCTESVLKSQKSILAVLNIGFRAVLDLPPKLLWENQKGWPEVGRGPAQTCVYLWHIPYRRICSCRATPWTSCRNIRLDIRGEEGWGKIPSVLVYVSISWPVGRALDTVNGTITRLQEIWRPHICSVEILFFGSTVYIIVYNGPDAFCRCVGQAFSAWRDYSKYCKHERYSVLSNWYKDRCPKLWSCHP